MRNVHVQDPPPTVDTLLQDSMDLFVWRLHVHQTIGITNFPITTSNCIFYSKKKKPNKSKIIKSQFFMHLKGKKEKEEKKKNSQKLKNCGFFFFLGFFLLRLDNCEIPQLANLKRKRNR